MNKENRKIFTGPRGGRYYLDKSGKKHYLTSGTPGSPKKVKGSPKKSHSSPKLKKALKSPKTNKVVSPARPRKAVTFSRSTKSPSPSPVPIKPPKKVAKKTASTSPKKTVKKNQDSPRGAAGWGKDSPKPGKERHALKDKCGEKCFLLPKDEKFPICPKLGIGKDCKEDRRGLIAAKIRAKQHGYDKVYAEADKKLQKINKSRK
jgi:hypothetical protein